LLALRYVLPSKNPNRRRYRLDGREFADDARQLAEIVADAESVDVTLVGQPIVDEGAPATAAEPSGDEELAAPELDSLLEGRRGRRERPYRGGDRGADHGAPRPGVSGSNGPSGPGPDRYSDRRPAPSGSAGRLSPLPTDLGSLAAAVRSLTTPELRPAFLGLGSFGGPWNRSD
jgi:hypothetical protein